MTPHFSHADLMGIGEGWISGSWTQMFQENGVGLYNKMEIFMNSSSAADFEGTGFSAFSTSGWTSSLVNPDYAIANGTGVADSMFNITFTSEISDPIGFDFLAWNDNSLREAAHAVWNGSGWTFTVFTSTYNPETYNRSAAVPEPATLLLVGAGLLGIGICRRKFSN